MSASQSAIEQFENSLLSGTEILRSLPFGWIMFERRLRIDVICERPLEMGVTLAVGMQSVQGGLKVLLDFPAASCNEVPDRLVDQLILWPAQYFAQRGETRLNDRIDPVGGGLPGHTPERIAAKQ